jgi:putative lipoic acid-binding regulatory protein
MDELIRDLNKSERISFPVNFELKVIMDATIPENENKANIEALLQRLEIKCKYLRKRLSKNGRYMGFTYTVTLEDHKKLKALYDELKALPGLKFAV